MLRTFLRHNLPYLIIYLLVCVVVAYILLNNDRSELHIRINSLVGNRYVDTFFKYMTYVGDGVFVIALALVLILLFNIRKGLLVFYSYASASLCTTILKRCFYDDVNRPFYVFTYFRHEQLKLVDGVERLIHNSFPSGHSTAAFAMFFSLMYMTERQGLKILYFVAAFLAAFSRTYLSQHWLIDIFAGSMIGAGFATCMYLLVYNRPHMIKLEKPLISYFIK
ncbi:MAG: phosphatase PAP2 family protein [Bacteroidetes bacterium]|nr:phosphatase PAP2 family protein [Bacteroidota bacterium]